MYLKSDSTRYQQIPLVEPRAQTSKQFLSTTIQNGMIKMFFL